MNRLPANIQQQIYKDYYKNVLNELEDKTEELRDDLDYVEPYTRWRTDGEYWVVEEQKTYCYNGRWYIHKSII